MANIAIIPARLGSKGFPAKNRLFFSLTAEFIVASNIFDKVIVNTDDKCLLRLAQDEGFEIFKRSKSLAGDNVSIKEVFVDMIKKIEINDDDYLWLFYVPLLYKDTKDFQLAEKLIKEKKPDSLSTFIPVKNHPYNCWKYDVKKRKIKKYIENDLYNRQDFPNAWENYHYVFAIRANAVEHSDNNMLSNKTEPILLDSKTANRLIEIDTPEDLMKWKYNYPIAYENWFKKLNEKYKKMLFKTVN